MPDEGGWKIWQTPGFRIESDADLANEDLRRIAQIAESTAWVVKQHELPLASPPEGRTPIRIFSRDEDFIAAGGPKLSAGAYDAPRGRLMLRRSSWLRQPEGGVRRDVVRDEKLLVHELTHLNMHGHLGRLPQWFIEGIAEYFASAHRGAGRFDFSNPDASVRDHLRARANPRDPVVRLAGVAGIAALQDYKQWMAHLEKLPMADRVAPYGTALLLTHYYLHGGPERIEWLRERLTERRPGRGLRPTVPVIETDGVEEALRRYWKPRGLDPVFSIGLHGR